MKKPSEDDTFERIADLAEETAKRQPARAPSKLKSRIYSAMIERQEETGPLRVLSETKADGRGLCVFEDTVRIPQLKSFQYCKVCHARVLAEKFEKAPIWWPNCPYAEFQGE